MSAVMASIVSATGGSSASPLGSDYWLVLAPVIIAVVLVAAILLTRRASRRGVPDKPPEGDKGAHRGAVQGGVIQGSPSQRNRRDEAPRQD
ncbi:hypothetical protein [Actinomadura macrotermitis]|uniref:Uncharacterized protein n=1 Tax=Actinomadura macrotermitis TaxID=2585200 RepID=A0A7K0BTA9_9ACTN|nr:hypothetical protein [Actinomadura macrotermitis]MQY04409.1 hypothetical protein [Actinomadura macrotermitis]